MASYNKYKQHKACKKDRQIIIACSMTSKKSMGLVHVTRRKKKKAESFLIDEELHKVAVVFYSLNLTINLDKCKYYKLA